MHKIIFTIPPKRKDTFIGKNYNSIHSTYEVTFFLNKVQRRSATEEKKVCRDDYLRSSSRSITTWRWRGGKVSALFHREQRWRIISNVISEHKNTYERRIIDTYMCGVVSKVDDIDDINNMYYPDYDQLILPRVFEKGEIGK